MTPIAPHITAFLRERLPLERGASPHTCDSYAYSFQLLFEFASQRLGCAPSQLTLEQIDALLVMDFLAYIETQRDNCPTTRNARLAWGVQIGSEPWTTFWDSLWQSRFSDLRWPCIFKESELILGHQLRSISISTTC